MIDIFVVVLLQW